MAMRCEMLRVAAGSKWLICLNKPIETSITYHFDIMYTKVSVRSLSTCAFFAGVDPVAKWKRKNEKKPNENQENIIQCE